MADAINLSELQSEVHLATLRLDALEELRKRRERDAREERVFWTGLLVGLLFSILLTAITRILFR